MNCTHCGVDISERYKITGSILCVDCKLLEQDDFKWHMKTVGFDEEPKIAKTEEQWNTLKKQRKVKDI